MGDVFAAFAKGLLLLFCIVFLAWRMYRRWRGATEYVAGMQEEERRQRASFERMPLDPWFMRLKGYLDTRYRTSWVATPDPSVFRIHYATFQDTMGLETWAGQSARWLVAYLKGHQGKVIVTLDLVTGQVHERSAGFFDWDLVPVWAR